MKRDNWLDRLEEEVMGRTGRRYSSEFKIEALRLITEEGRPVAEVARELDVSPSTLWRWRLQMDPARDPHLRRAAATDPPVVPEDVGADEAPTAETSVAPAFPRVLEPARNRNERAPEENGVQPASPEGPDVGDAGEDLTPDPPVVSASPSFVVPVEEWEEDLPEETLGHPDEREDPGASVAEQDRPEPVEEIAPDQTEDGTVGAEAPGWGGAEDGWPSETRWDHVVPVVPMVVEAAEEAEGTAPDETEDGAVAEDVWPAETTVDQAVPVVPAAVEHAEVVEVSTPEETEDRTAAASGDYGADAEEPWPSETPVDRADPVVPVLPVLPEVVEDIEEAADLEEAEETTPDETEGGPVATEAPAGSDAEQAWPSEKPVDKVIPVVPEVVEDLAEAEGIAADETEDRAGAADAPAGSDSEVDPPSETPVDQGDPVVPEVTESIEDAYEMVSRQPEDEDPVERPRERREDHRRGPSRSGRRERRSTDETRHTPQSGLTPPTEPPGALDLFQVASAIKKRAWLVVGTTVLGLALAGIWVALEVPRYRATAVLRVGEAREALTQGIEAPSRAGDRFANPLLSRVQLLRSRSLLAGVVDSVGFRLEPEYRRFSAELLDTPRLLPVPEADTLWLEFGQESLTVRTRQEERTARYGQRLAVGGVSFAVASAPSADQATWVVTSREEAIDRLLDDLRVSPREDTDVVDVSFLHPDPGTAQFVVNTLVRAYQDFEAQFSQERSRRRRIFIEEQVRETDARLADARRSLSGFQTRAQSYDARQELNAQQQNRMVLDIRIEELNADRRMLQGLLDRLDASTGGARAEVLLTLVSSPGISENAVVSQIHQRLLRHRTVMDSLTLGDFGAAASSPDVQRQAELISGAERELTDAIRSHVASLDARAVGLSELAARTNTELAAIPPQLAQEARLGQIVETYQRMSDQLHEEFQKARMAEAVSIEQADIIDLANLPYEPVPGLRLAVLGLGLLLGLSVGGAGALTLESRNRSVTTKEEIEEMFRLPVLGVIPKAEELVLAEIQARRSPDWSEDRESENGSGSRYRTTYAAEAYRMLRTNFLFAGWTKDVRSIVVTSTAPQEGKTITASNLAACIAEEEGIRVLLVDADLWRGRTHEIFDVPESPGLGELLGRAAPVHECIRDTGVPGLSLLPSGNGGPSPSLLARGNALRRVLEELGQDFDAVIVDGPPVLAAGSAPVLAAVADGVLLLVKAGGTERDAVREALRALHTVGARVLGAVLNDPDSVSPSGDRRYHYYEYADS